MQMNFYGRAVAVLGLTALAAFGAACTTDENSGSTDSAIPVVDAAVKHDLQIIGDIGASTDLACTPEVESCSGLCGPVRDNCTGQTFQCGGCASGTVCNLDSHTCITPEDTCAQLGRTCGSTKNSCGQTITCTPFYCPSNNEECNPDSNLCQPCEAVTCEDLGYQCGPAWLGCGSNTNTVDCGSCPTNQVCNNALHICEPSNGGTCGGMTAAQVCDAAAMSDGVQCGNISNGCGSLINCTGVAGEPTKYVCPTGQTCGGAGIPNHCDPAEPPTECVAANYNCGTLASACGGTVSCGTCDAASNMVCTIAPGQTAGVCSLVCNEPQKSCNSDYANQCGTQLDNNCWPNKLDCPCGTGQVCSSSTPGVAGTCSAPAACGQYTTGASGQKCSTSPSSAFPEGNGSDLTCPCSNAGANPGQEVCTNIGSDGSGTCCTHTACTGNEATVMDTCTGQTLNCCSGSQKVYNGMCCTPKTTAACPNDGNYDVIDDGCGGEIICDCNRFPGTPDDPTSPPTQVGGSAACCAPPTCGTQCGGTVKSTCSGKSTGTCTTAVCTGAMSGQTKDCVGNACCYATRPACPNDGEFHRYTDSCGVAYTCDCNRFPSTPLDPKDSNGNVLDGNGCCTGPAACGTDCSGDTHATTCGMPTTTSSGTTSPTKVAATVTCNTCSNTQCCNAGTCKTANTCSGSTCGNIGDGCGGTKDCSCANGETCSGSTCTCPTLVCSGCNPGSQSNGCSTIDCTCKASGQVCGTSNACCTPQTCANLPSGTQCGQFKDTCTGNTISCGCSTPQMPNSACNGSGQCVCTPTKCCSDTGGVTPCLQPGPYSNDGCGNAGTCAT